MLMKTKPSPWKRALLWLLAAALLLWLLLTNLVLTVTPVEIVDPRLPQAFDGLRIALAADLHNHPWGSRLTGLLRQQQPDLIAVCGDLIDSARTHTDTALAFVREAAAIAPVYYVTGNHEAWARQKAPSFLADLAQAGAQVLTDEWVTLENAGQTLRIAGLRDPAYGGSTSAALRHVLTDAPYTILLSHRPELFEQYVLHGAELVLAGHAHGGQFRLPWLGGLIAPDQGLLPRWTAGVYRRGNTAMVVSRGLGNSVIPLRIGNPPELVVVTLRCGS
jgi:predicted MPP superfamily phosphohydrolase